MRHLLLVVLLVTTAAGSPLINCTASDNLLADRMNVLCASIGGPNGVPSWCNTSVPAAQDWPNQAYYMHDVLHTLASETEIPPGCFATPLVLSTLHWLSDTNTLTSGWWSTWVVFQVQYYDMPRARQK